MSYQISSRHVLCSLLWILLFLGPLLFVPLSPAQEQITIPCEVMEASKPFSTSSSKITGIRYILLHHAHSEDREMLSEWLKTYSGTEVTFIVNQKEHITKVP
jgi:hypothetical protein